MLYVEPFSFMLCDFWTHWTQHHSQKRVLQGDHMLNLVTLDSNISDLPQKDIHGYSSYRHMANTTISGLFSVTMEN